jgi:RNA polymerase sigma-70 factor (ECF subfamily)
MPIVMSLIRWLLALPHGTRRPGTERSARAERIVREQLDVACRTARRLGVPASELDDVAQEVMLVVVRRLDAIDPDKERAFVAATSVRVAANWRRQRRRRHEQPSDELDQFQVDQEALLSRPSELGAEDSLERARKLQLLQAALDSMTEPQRVAFILFELEELTAREIAQQLHLPVAAVTSRARRAREAFISFCQQHAEERAAAARSERIAEASYG